MAENREVTLAEPWDNGRSFSRWLLAFADKSKRLSLMKKISVSSAILLDILQAFYEVLQSDAAMLFILFVEQHQLNNWVNNWVTFG